MPNEFKVKELFFSVTANEFRIGGGNCGSPSLFEVQEKCTQNTAQLVSAHTSTKQRKLLKQKLLAALSELEALS